MTDIRNFFKKVPNPNNKRTREQVDNEEAAIVPKSPPKKPVVSPAKPPKKSVVSPAKPPVEMSPQKKIKTKEVDPVEKKRRSENYKSFMNRGGADAPGSKNIPDGAKNCLKDLAFVISGVLESLERDECKDLIEKYGGRVTSALSGKTNYLLAGRDGGESKMKKAHELNIKIISEDDLLDLIRTRPGDEEPLKTEKSKRKSKTVAEPEQPVVASSSSTKLKRKSSSITETSAVEPVVPSKIKKTASSASSTIPKTATDDSSLLWVDKYKPRTIKQLIGQQGDKSPVQKLIIWLRDWYQHHSQSDEKVKAKPSVGFIRNENPAMFKAALLSGPPGIGKTTAAQLVCEHLNYQYIEKNASDQRSKKSMSTLSSDTYSIAHFTEKSMSKYVLIMDEVDGVAGNEDRGGIQELISLIKRSRIPIICICNDRQHKKIRSLANYCYDLRFHRPNVQQIHGAMLSILHHEHIQNISPETLDDIIKSSNQDIRQTIHSLNLWSIQGGQTNSTAAKMINKTVNTNPFELCRLSFSSEFRDKSLSDKSDIFFYDYQLMPLLIQENYLQCQPHVTSSNNEKRKLTDVEHLNLLANAADHISLGDICSQMIFSKNDSWSLLPYQAIFSTVTPCSYVRGHLRGMVNFSSFFGQRSRTNKNERLLNEIEKHVCLKTSSANKQQFNLDYLPYLSRALISPLQQQSQSNGIEQCISLLDDYYLNRDDFQTIMELNTWGKTARNPYDQLDTQTKSALTRNYNKTNHRAPYAMIDIKKLKKSKGLMNEEENDEDDDEEEEESAPIENDVMIKADSSTMKVETEAKLSATLFTFHMKYVSLLLLTFQNVASILLLRYVRTTTGPRFINSTAVLNSEIQKTLLSIFFVIYEERSVVKGLKLIYEKVFHDSHDTIKTGIPAFLYLVQNYLLFVSISNLDAATCQVSFQLKIFTTAIFMMLILGRTFKLVQWLALFLLFLGVSLVQLENMTSTVPKQDVNAIKGLLSVVGACTLSGLAGVYFEKILKGSNVSVWIRNIQLGIFSIIFGSIMMLIQDGTEIQKKGFLFGYTPIVWTTITIQSAGGLLVALVVKHADNILKGFSTSAAIIISCIVSMILFDFQLTNLFALGAFLVVCSIFLYSKPDLILQIPFLKEKSILF
ncbi:unnamed protein product [Adineta ricciae]|uniref:Replication factor C subunit 1 n=1 Tax=Adineta ricciae TaxID=249248 RepID=A0A813SQS7_ADIRI|nr:unnamed protein product [Adineta ricciae]